MCTEMKKLELMLITGCCLVLTILILDQKADFGIDNFLRLKSPSEKFKESLDKRSRNLKIACKKSKETLLWENRNFKKNLKSNLWDFKNSLVYCPVAKVASTTWYLNFLEILNINMESLRSLQETRVKLTKDTEYIKQGVRGKVSKIDFRSVVRNITAPDGWNFKQLNKVKIQGKGSEYLCHKMEANKSLVYI